MKAFMIGAGDIAKSHARAVEKLGGSIVGAFDVSENALNSFTREFYCDSVSYEQIPEYVEKAEYVVISTPPTKRLDYVEMVLSKHVPLYLEKPIATTVEDEEKIVEMAKKYDGKIIVGFAHRFRPAFVKMHEMVKSGMFGEPVNVFSYRVGPGYGYGKNNAIYGNSWRTDPKYACGMTIESVSHEFNLLTALAGEFETIACNVKGTMPSIPQYDTNSTMVMRCKNGAVASIMTSWSSGAGANIGCVRHKKLLHMLVVYSIHRYNAKCKQKPRISPRLFEVTGHNSKTAVYEGSADSRRPLRGAPLRRSRRRT